MLDWDTYAGSDPGLLGEPGPSLSPEPGAFTWFPPAPADDVQTWLVETPPKGNLDDFGPTFIEGDVSTIDDVVVTGVRPTRLVLDLWYADEVPSAWNYEGGGSSGGGPPLSAPDCSTSDDIGMITAPDGAQYKLPEGVTADDLLAAIAHLQSFSDPASKLAAFHSMFDNPNDPFFIDFKDWGTSNGPPGSVSGGTATYWSDAAGGYVTGSVFEAFGNYFYGFCGVLGGIPAEVLTYTAGLVQTGNSFYERFTGQDGAQDRPHVAKGIADALTAAALQSLDLDATVFSVSNGSCSTGVTGGGTV